MKTSKCFCSHTERDSLNIYGDQNVFGSKQFVFFRYHNMSGIILIVIVLKSYDRISKILNYKRPSHYRIISDTELNVYNLDIDLADT